MYTPVFLGVIFDNFRFASMFLSHSPLWQYTPRPIPFIHIRQLWPFYDQVTNLTWPNVHTKIIWNDKRAINNTLRWMMTPYCLPFSISLPAIFDVLAVILYQLSCSSGNMSSLSFWHIISKQCFNSRDTKPLEWKIDGYMLQYTVG